VGGCKGAASYWSRDQLCIAYISGRWLISPPLARKFLREKTCKTENKKKSSTPCIRVKFYDEIVKCPATQRRIVIQRRRERRNTTPVALEVGLRAESLIICCGYATRSVKGKRRTECV